MPKKRESKEPPLTRPVHIPTEVHRDLKQLANRQDAYIGDIASVLIQDGIIRLTQRLDGKRSKMSKP